MLRKVFLVIIVVLFSIANLYATQINSSWPGAIMSSTIFRPIKIIAGTSKKWMNTNNHTSKVTWLRGNSARYAVVTAAIAPEAPTIWNGLTAMAAWPQAAKTPPAR